MKRTTLERLRGASAGVQDVTNAAKHPLPERVVYGMILKAVGFAIQTDDDRERLDALAAVAAWAAFELDRSPEGD